MSARPRAVSSRRRLLDALRDHNTPVEDPAGAIAEFRVMVDGAIITNPNSFVRRDARIVVKAKKEPRGVRKLGHAIDHFGVPIAGSVAVDLGACTGGFTVALLNRGAMRVYAVEVGFGQLLGSLRQNPRVVNLERTNLAAITPALLGGHPDVIVADITKLSLREVGRQIAENDVPRARTTLVGLVKPMFELATSEPPANRDDLDQALSLAVDGLKEAGWEIVASMESEIRGHHGSVEFFVHARWPA